MNYMDAIEEFIANINENKNDIRISLFAIEHYATRAAELLQLELEKE